MAEDLIGYDRLIQQSLRGVVRGALEKAMDGLPGEHHFYITFKTRALGVVIPKHLHHQYPEDMTIVIQHRYWDLEVGPSSFGISLSFNQVPEHLTIPYEAITLFHDPSIPFGLQFDVRVPSLRAASDIPTDGDEPAGGDTAAQGEATTPDEGGPDDGDEPPKGNGDGRVVSLDAFRKK